MPTNFTCIAYFNLVLILLKSNVKRVLNYHNVIMILRKYVTECYMCISEGFQMSQVYLSHKQTCHMWMYLGFGWSFKCSKLWRKFNKESFDTCACEFECICMCVHVYLTICHVFGWIFSSFKRVNFPMGFLVAGATL